MTFIRCSGIIVDTLGNQGRKMMRDALIVMAVASCFGGIAILVSFHVLPKYAALPVGLAVCYCAGIFTGRLLRYLRG